MSPATTEGPVRVVLRMGPSGRQEALVDDVPVMAAMGQSVKDAALVQVARIASARGQGDPREITAVICDEDEGGQWPLIVSATGQVRAELPPTPAAERSRWRPPAWKASLGTGLPRVSWRGASRLGASPVAARPGRGSALLIAGVAAFLVAALVFAVTTLTRNDPATTVSMGSGVYPGTAPGGFTAQARWVTPALLPGAGPVVGAGDRAFFVTADRKVVAVDAQSGDVAWTRDLPDGVPRGVLAATTVAGTPAVAIHLGDHLCWWSRDDGRPHQVDLPVQGAVSYLGDGPLIGMDASSVAVIDDQDRLRRTMVPAGALALAARADGRVTAASSAGWWHLTPGQAPSRPTPLEVPDPAQTAPTARPVIASYVGGSILTIWPTDAQGKTHAAVYHDDASSVWLSFRAPLQISDPKKQTQLTWTPSPARTWGILGRTMIDVKGGRAEDLGAWTTTFVGIDRALGTVAGRPAQVGPALPRTTHTPGTGAPETDTPAGIGIRHQTDGHQQVYLLPPTN
ncbi:hypothetical protein [Arsenicicoccus dermatophilus]|uniref:hypothetical protein n=1 Tax=Arsenicicoccus dermatophilus TaxID=1076331 RepID=UPI003916D645